MSPLMVDFLYFSNIDLSGRQIIYLVEVSLYVVGEGLGPPGRRLPAEDQLVCVSRVFYGDFSGGGKAYFASLHFKFAMQTLTLPYKLLKQSLNSPKNTIYQLHNVT